MTRSFSLRSRLNLAFAALLALGLLADVALTILGAGNRVEPEIANSTALVGGIIRGALGGMRDGPGVRSQLVDLATRLDKLRHVSVTFEAADAAASPAPAVEAADKRKPPEWFVALIHPPTTVQRIDAVVDGRALGAFVVAGDPDDEIAELWDGVVELALDGGAAAVGGFVVLYFLVGAALRPLEKLDDGLKALGAGDYRVRLASDVAPEFAELVSRFNALGDSLLAAESENQRLRARLVSAQEDERKEIARELHDEIGPHLFAARAQAGLARQSARDSPDRAAEALDALIASIDALQEGNRRILNWLRPAALERSGLLESFEDLRLSAELARPGMRVELDLPVGLPRLTSRFQAALYRIAQEALTNAARHAGADAVRLSLTVRDGREVVLRVVDDGIGFDPGKRRFGLGLLGIGERVASHGGKLELLPAAPRGLELRATFPRGAIDNPD
jgi:two-component system sensor histidine kinase UhpB